MPATGFHSEWATVQATRNIHRILLECRASFPGHREHFIAAVAAEFVDHQTENARVVHVYYDDKACNPHVKIATSNPDDEKIVRGLEDVFGAIYGYGNCSAEVVVLEPGDTHSDHYEHMEYLSVGADIAVDRWKHQDAKYQAEVHPPR